MPAKRNKYPSTPNSFSAKVYCKLAEHEERVMVRLEQGLEVEVYWVLFCMIFSIECTKAGFKINRTMLSNIM